MRRISPLALRFVTLASAIAIAAPAVAASTDYFLKLGGVEGDTEARGDDKHKDWIEILSYSFGETRKLSKIDAFTIKQGTAAAGGVGTGPGTGKVVVHDISATAPSATGGEKGGTEDINIGVGELQESRGGVSVAAGDVTSDGRSAASGLPTGKRQHKPFTLSKPLDKGSIMLVGRFPNCRVGAHYPTVELAGPTTYRLADVVVASCGGTSGSDSDDRPSETVSLNYTKIEY